jgi:ARC6-like, IMS domain
MVDSAIMPHRPPPPSRNRVRTCAALCLLLLAAGCSPPGENPEVDRGEIEQMLRDYLPKLGAAYAEEDPTILEEFAVPKEVARISLRIEELRDQGRVYEPEFQQVTVEDVSVWNYANAFVSTLEVWDVRSFTIGSHVLVQESLGQRSRVKYQLKRKDGSWVILYRELAQTLEP